MHTTCKEWRGGEINPDRHFKRKAGPKNWESVMSKFDSLIKVNKI